MIFDFETEALPNTSQLISRKAHIDLHNTMAVLTREMMMMRTTTDAIVMCAISKIDTIKQPFSNKRFYRAIDRSAPKACFFSS